ncbi:hypothetical protein E5Q_03927 [Mixia osmundae IAM 14324]|uniref:DNA-directed RNA polymerase I subunit RPA49 n=2 Tax=Mixia osmundae (strain CBS 9802 / IAM 14324 / JCM 22182 / KY 12970) TaxID=764103 RepID=G7E369_MIXOS|nr:hypothetical protein E5Q_03927 [Mixia osmundae IAM 14324]
MSEPRRKKQKRQSTQSDVHASPSASAARGALEGSSSSGTVTTLHVPSDASENSTLAVLGSFSASKPPRKLKFDHVEEQRSSKSAVVARDGGIVWESKNHMSLNRNRPGYACKYLLGVRNKRTNLVTLFPTRLHTIHQSIPAHSAALPDEDEALPDPLARDYRGERASLGNAFGTRKAQRAILAAERNRLDISEETLATKTQPYLAPELLRDDEDEVAQEAKAALVKAAQEDAALIPPFDREATEVDQIYPMSTLMPDEEFKAIDYRVFGQAEKIEERLALLPTLKSEFVTRRLRAVLPEGRRNKLSSAEKRRIRQVVYLSCLHAFRSGQSVGKDAVANRLGLFGNPMLVERFIERFTEKGRSGGPQMTKASQKKLNNWILVCCLVIDDFDLDVQSMADDFGISAKKMTLSLSALGCKIVKPNAADIVRLRTRVGTHGQPFNESSRRAVLLAPLTFPELRRGGPIQR